MPWELCELHCLLLDQALAGCCILSHDITDKVALAAENSLLHREFLVTCNDALDAKTTKNGTQSVSHYSYEQRQRVWHVEA